MSHNYEDDPYIVLGVPHHADQETIKAAYRRLVKKHHPDISGSSQAQRITQRLIKAYEVLGNPRKRHEFDRKHGRGQSTPVGDPYNRYTKENARTIEISFEELLTRIRQRHPLVNLDLSGFDLSGRFLDELDFSGSLMVGSNMVGCKMSRTVARGADFTRADLRTLYAYEARFDRATFIGADLSYAEGISNCSFIRAVFDGAKLNRVGLVDSDLSLASFRNANLNGGSLSGCRCEGVDFRGANLSGVSFYGANLEGANLEGAKLEATRLRRARNLKGAVMPDGDTAEAWFK